MESFFYIINLISWLSLLILIPLTGWILWIKSRGSLDFWVRFHIPETRYTIKETLPAKSDRNTRQIAIGRLVSTAQNAGWNAPTTILRKTSINHDDGQLWEVGLVSKDRPDDGLLDNSELPPTPVIRVSGKSRDDGVTPFLAAKQWADRHGLELQDNGYTLQGQSYHLWEWPIDASTLSTNRCSSFSEKIFEMRDIALFPALFTTLTVAMLGTGSSWLIGIGVFLIILLSGAHKFVFLHQREDLSQESHLQNY